MQPARTPATSRTIDPLIHEPAHQPTCNNLAVFPDLGYTLMRGTTGDDMTQVDQFESVFRSAVGNPFVFDRPEYASVLIIADLDGDPASAYAANVKRFLAVIEPAQWSIIEGKAFSTTEDLSALVSERKPDLIVTYRNLHSSAWKSAHSLGTHVDVLIQQSEVPVLLTPNPRADYQSSHAMEDTNSVTAVTDHLLNDHRLVNAGARFTQKDGTLHLMHIEDDATYDRYIDAISKIPTINTDQARKVIGEQLLKEPARYISECTRVLKEEGLSISLTSCVEFGHLLKAFEAHISDYKTDLLVMNTKDEDQLAMHGLAYPLAVELRHIAILML